LDLEGTQVEVYFSPDDGTITRLLELVRGVFDESQAKSNQGGEYERLLENGVEVRLDGNPRGMHHKVILIDNQIVVTGSYNFSNNAKTRNDENTLIIHSAEVAALYRDEFERVWGEAKVSHECDLKIPTLPI
jgi:phosphatidylserine/phosphatidylglycerophosphate/cardiolipin synthase-like enzyme